VKLVRVLLFPVTLALSLAWGVFGLGRGYSPTLVVALGAGLGILAVVLGERWLPFAAEWKREKGDVVTDCWHGIVSNLAVPPLIKAGLALLLAPAARAILAPWPNHWPLLCQLILAAVIAEFCAYWAHRWAHERDALWRLHATHHSAERLYWLNAGRDHPFGVFLLFAAEIVPLLLLGANESVFAMFALFTAVHGLFQHANVDVRLGPLNFVFSMAELHRWHHSRDVSEANHNYGSNLIVWDVVFGTRYLPDARRPPIDVGIDGIPGFPRDYLGQLTVPFRWRELHTTSPRPPSCVHEAPSQSEA